MFIMKNIQEYPMKRISFFAFALIYTIFSSLTAFGAVTTEKTRSAANALTLDAQAAILMDAGTGEIIYSKNINERLYPASITKLMTVLLCLENCQKDEEITFSENAVYSIEPGSSHIAIVPGEVLTVEQCLYGIMLQSANEVSNAVAEHIDGSIEDFCLHMTQRAKELGCENTNFVNPNGLHDENHYTSAKDMALIAKKLLKFPYFKEIMASVYYEIPPTNLQSETRYLHGQNQLIKPASIFYYEYCEGGKTGFTNEAGNTLVAYAKKDDTELISVVLKSTGYGEYTDTKALFDYGFENYHTVQLGNETATLGSMDIIKSGGEKVLDTVEGTLAQTVFATIPSEYSAAEVQQSIDITPSTETLIVKGSKMGTAVYTLNGETVAEADIIAKRSASVPIEDTAEPKPPVNFKLVIVILIFVGVLLILWRIINSKIQKERRKRRRRKRRAAQRAAMENKNEISSN